MKYVLAFLLVGTCLCGLPATAQMSPNQSFAQAQKSSQPARCNMLKSQAECIACAQSRGFKQSQYMRPDQCGGKK
jgi:hypothetical protein